MTTERDIQNQIQFAFDKGFEEGFKEGYEEVLEKRREEARERNQRFIEALKELGVSEEVITAALKDTII